MKRCDALAMWPGGAIVSVNVRRAVLDDAAIDDAAIEHVLERRLCRASGGLWTTGRPDDPRRSKPDRLRRGSQSSPVLHSPDSRAHASLQRNFISGSNSGGVGLFWNAAVIVRFLDQSCLEFLIDSLPASGDAEAFPLERGSAAVGARQDGNSGFSPKVRKI